MNPETTPYDEQVTYWMLDAIQVHADGGTIAGLRQCIADIDLGITTGSVYAQNLRPVLDGWKKALASLESSESNTKLGDPKGSL